MKGTVLKQEGKAKVGLAGAPRRRKLPPLSTYCELPPEYQFKVLSRAEQVLKVHYVEFEGKKGGVYRFFYAGRTSEDIAKRIEKLKDFGQLKANYCVFQGTYKDAVNILKKRIRDLLQISEEILTDTPDVPLDRHMCLLADYVKLAESLTVRIKEAFDLVDEIYQTLESIE